MKLLLPGTPVSPSRVVDVFAASGIWPRAPRCSTPYAQEVPFSGLTRRRAFAAVPAAPGVAGEIRPQPAPGSGPAGMPQRTQHVDLDPHRPRPSGGCG